MTKTITIPTKQIVCLILFFLCYSVIASAQTKVNAREIEKRIKAGEDVSYKNVTITGVLDMTPMREALPDLPKKKKWNNNNNTIEDRLEGKVSFINCTFENHVYAYYNDDNIDHTDGDSHYTFVSHFEEEVIFKDCHFKRRAWFKYSKFDEKTDFSGTVFEDSSTFKYSQFDKEASFADTHFEEDNTFKYSEFDRHVSFENAIFEEDAIFKYTKFRKGTSFKNTTFKDDLDFKYTEFRGPFDDENMTVRGRMDTKYTNYYK